jgi:enamine deaminase RidA (YjgF/YER057c/UK114 family)
MIDKRIVRTEALRQPIASFSHAVRYGDLTFVGAKGSVAAGHVGAVHAGDVSAQAAQALGNARTALEALGARLEDTVQLRVWLQDWRYRTAVDAVIDHLMTAAPLARPAYCSPAFPFPAFMIEFDIIAAAPALARERIGRGGTEVVRAGDLVFVEQQSGTIEPDAAGSAADQAARALERLYANLAGAGVGADRVLQVTTALADLRDLPAFLAAWRRSLPPPRPPLVLFGSSLRDARARIEVSGIASLTSTRRAALGSASEESATAIAGDLGFTAGSNARVIFGDTSHRGGEPSEELVRCLRAGGFEPGDVLRTDAVVADWRLYDRFDSGNRTHFMSPFPARTTVQAHLGDGGAIAQLAAIAGSHPARHEVLVSA